MKGTRVWRHFDYVLLAVTVLLVAYGVVMIQSATRGSQDSDVLGVWRRQAVVGVAGVGLIFLLAAFPRDYQWLGDFWWLAYLLAAALLVLVLFLGRSQVSDVRSWFDLGGLDLQPAYLAMILLAVSVGAVLSRRQRSSSGNAPLFGTPRTSLVDEHARPAFRHYASSVAMTLVLAGLVFVQPDLATAAVLVAMWLAMAFESNVPLRYLVVTAVVGLAALYPLWKLTEVFQFDYMRMRVLRFFDPEPDYQVGQALIAIGSGGLWGKGLGQGTQSQLRYLPVRHTDFVFAVTAEELGFAGVLLLFALYALLFARLLRVVFIASDTFGRLLATGVLAMILFQATVNIGMNVGLLPVAGLPLPFISYGSTALLTTMVGVGLAENVVMRHRKLDF